MHREMGCAPRRSEKRYVLIAGGVSEWCLGIVNIVRSEKRYVLIVGGVSEWCLGIVNIVGGVVSEWCLGILPPRLEFSKFRDACQSPLSQNLLSVVVTNMVFQHTRSPKVWLAARHQAFSDNVPFASSRDIKLRTRLFMKLCTQPFL